MNGGNVETHLGRLGVDVTSLTILLLHMLYLLPHACVVSKVLHGWVWAVLRRLMLLLLLALVLLGLHERRVEVGQHRILRETFCHLLSGSSVMMESRCLSRAAVEPHRGRTAG
jgi:hypothetical protein